MQSAGIMKNVFIKETGRLINSNYAGVKVSEHLYYLKRFFIDSELAKKLVQDKV